jgi:hypothetical protein
MSAWFWLQTLKERDQLGDLCIDGRRIFNFDIEYEIALDMGLSWQGL